MPDIDADLEILSEQDVDININAQALYGPKGDKGDKGDKGEQGIQGIQGPQGNDGYSPVANVTKNGNTTTVTITDANGTTTAEILDGTDGQDGADGADGYSPVATVSKVGSVTTISVTDKNGTTTAEVNDGTNGTNGQDGQDGYSPTATVTKSGSVTTITITDKNGTTTAQVSDGVGSVTDVQQNGVSVVSSGVANVTVPTALSGFTDDLGNSPTHTHNQYEETTNKGVAGGYASLGNDGKVPTSQLPIMLPEMSASTANKFLGNDGTNASWQDITGGAEITYADSTTADLEKVKYQTTSTYAGRSSFPKNQMDIVEDIGDNYNPLYFANVKTISASTSYTYSQNGTFCTGSSSVATVTITKSGSSVTIYGNVVRIPRGCTFTSSVAGKFFFDDNYYGYLAS